MTELTLIPVDYLADEYEPPPSWLSPEYVERERAATERRAALRIVTDPPTEQEKIEWLASS